MSLFQKIFLSSFLFILNENVTAQIDSTYVPFPTDSVAWNESGSQSVDIGIVDYHSYFLFLVGDTLIDTLTYSKLFRGPKAFDTNTANFIGGLREENKKIYIQSVFDGSYPEMLYYDFTLNVGDTLVWNNRVSYVTGIGYIQIADGSYRKSYSFQTQNGFHTKIVEGLGNVGYSYAGLLNPNTSLFFENTNVVNCVFTPNEVIYKRNQFSDQNCDELVYTSIKKIQTIDNITYPNPFENSLYFKEIISNSKGVIYSISGQKMLEIELLYTNEINLSRLEKGIYFLQVLGAENFYTKIVKR